MNEVSLKPVIDELETLFSKFNKAFFEGKLEKPVITVSPDHTRGAYGWCTGWKAWQDGTKEGGYYEINLCAEYLNRPFEETCGTLLHEMVHLQNLQDNVQDTSRSGSYHNRKFKETAEAHGLTVEKGEKYGWHKTTLNPQAEAFVKSLGKSGFCLVRPRTNPLKGSRKGGDQVPVSMFAPVAEPPIKKISVKEAARCMGKSDQFVRIGLQRGLLPFGNAVPGTGNNWNYYINPAKFREYVGAEAFNTFFGLTA